MKIFCQIFSVIFILCSMTACLTGPANENHTSVSFANVNIGDNQLNPIGNRAPFTQLPDHFGKKLGLQQPSHHLPTKRLIRMGGPEMKEWFKQPKIILSVTSEDSGSTIIEEWVFPDGTAIRFRDSMATRGYYTINGSNLCFSYEYQNSYCPMIYKDQNSVYFQLMSDPDYWAHATIQAFNSSLSGHEVYDRITSGRGEEVAASFSASTNPLFVNMSLKASTNTAQQVTKPVHKITPNGQNDDIAIIIGNQRYNTQTSNIPNVDPARADVYGIYNYFLKVKNISKENILRIDNATQGDLIQNLYLVHYGLL